jgi:sterol desaturase/sphingolipid hydroxylase (fatty acid hydroxylase superfamily)
MDFLLLALGKFSADLRLLWEYFVTHRLDLLASFRTYGLLPGILILERIIPTRSIPVLPKGWISDIFHIFEPWVRATVVSWLAFHLSRMLPDVYPKGIAATLPIWGGFLVSLVVTEILFYAIHRSLHSSPWLWEFHRVHHSSTVYYSLMTSRFHVLDLAAIEVPNILFYAWFGIPAESIVYLKYFRSFMDRYVHSNIDSPHCTGYIFNTPHFHAWHHSNEPEAINKNFGRDTVFVDYLLGTAYYPKDRRAMSFGEASYSNNYLVQQILPFLIITGKAVAIFKSMRGLSSSR